MSNINDLLFSDDEYLARLCTVWVWLYYVECLIFLIWFCIFIFFMSSVNRHEKVQCQDFYFGRIIYLLQAQPQS